MSTVAITRDYDSSSRTLWAVPGVMQEDPPKVQTTQDISGRYISSIKLVNMLRIKFGVGSYDVHVRRTDPCAVE
jgi:hypothetical protein